jgi:hypothetical protein
LIKSIAIAYAELAGEGKFALINMSVAALGSQFFNIR